MRGVNMIMTNTIVTKRNLPFEFCMPELFSKATTFWLENKDIGQTNAFCGKAIPKR